MAGTIPAASQRRASQPPPQPGAQTRPATRQNPSQTKATKAELLKDSTSSIGNEVEAKDYLTTHGLLVGKEPFTIAQLSHTLLIMAHSTAGKTLTEGIRSVAILLDSESIAIFGKELSEVISEKLAPLEVLATTITEATRILTNQAERLYTTCEEARDEIQKSTDNLENVATQVISKELPTPGTPTNDAISYASATARNLPPTHRHTIARAENKEKQILVDKAPEVENDNLSKLSELELLAKANEAITQMIPETLEPSTARAVGAKKLNNGGVIYEMDSKETANWIREEKEAFMANFGGTAVVKERAVSTIAEYVPVTHTADSPTELRKIETESDIAVDSLISSRWIKPAHKRKKGQLTAHTILRFTSPELANKAIEKGLIIAGKRIQIRRLRREPRRCLKCQLVNTRHMAAECESNDVCGTCGKEHRTAECEETDPANYKCANCKGANHASWDRFCPTFLRACHRMQDADPESSYRFFPTKDPWTWEQNENAKKDNNDRHGGWSNNDGLDGWGNGNGGEGIDNTYGGGNDLEYGGNYYSNRGWGDDRAYNYNNGERPESRANAKGYQLQHKGKERETMRLQGRDASNNNEGRNSRQQSCGRRTTQPKPTQGGGPSGLRQTRINSHLSKDGHVPPDGHDPTN